MSKEQLAFQEALAFEQWMKETVKSIHYANNLKMSDAYERVITNYINT
jgi:hypothetical protein